MNKRKKIKLIIILALIAILVPVNITLSRYVKDFIKNYVFETNRFYFNSDKLEEGGITYNINNWSGVGTFDLQFSLNNYKNNILKSQSDIVYNISVTKPSDVLYSINANSGTLYTTEEKDEFTITVTPTRAYSDNESITITVTANATEPYTKTLSATYIVTVGKRGLSYEISDEQNRPYLNFIITNAKEEYTVRTAFGDYALNDPISIDEYMSLTPAEQANCASAIITLTFDPTVVLADTTSSIVNNATKTYTTVNGVSYVSSLTFKMDAASGTEIRFYKQNESLNYTYPAVQSTSIISFSAS